MKDLKKSSYVLIIISLILILVAGFTSTTSFYQSMTFKYSGDDYLKLPPYKLLLTLLTGLFLLTSFIVANRGMLKLSTTAKKTIIGDHTKISLNILRVFFVLILFLYAYFMFFFFNPPANFILRKTIPMFIFIYPVIHISIGLATFNWSGKWSLLINVPLFVICLPMIIASTSNDLVGLTMFLMTIYYLVPFIINIIVCQELLRWSRMERIKTLLKEQKRMSKTLNKLKADKKVHGFPEETYKKILNDHNYKMNKIKKEMEGIEAKIK